MVWRGTTAWTRLVAPEPVVWSTNTLVLCRRLRCGCLTSAAACCSTAREQPCMFYLLVGRVVLLALGVAHRRLQHPRHPLECELHPPEAACAKGGEADGGDLVGKQTWWTRRWRGRTGRGLPLLQEEHTPCR